MPIPISKETVMIIADEETGILYHFRPKIGMDEQTLLLACQALNGVMTQYKNEAEKRIRQHEGAKTLAVDVSAIDELAYQLREEKLADTGSTAALEDRKIMDPVVDRFLLKWEWEKPEGKNPLPEFPTKPSECFAVMDVYKIFNMVQDMNHLQEQDRKN